MPICLCMANHSDHRFHRSIIASSHPHMKKTDLEYVLMNRRIPNTNQHIQETGGPQHCGRILRFDEVWCLSNFKHLFNVSQGVGSLLPRQVWKDHPDGWRNRKLMRRYEKQRILDIFCQMLPGHEKLGVIWAGKMVVFTANARRMCGFVGRFTLVHAHGLF